LYNGTREWTEFDAVKDNVTSIDDISTLAAVHRQLMSDALWRIAFWRFDSSITSAVAKKYAQNVLSQTIQSMPGIHNCSFQ
jgi:asparagine synthase (glutamine-hydrolysing)